MVDATHQHFWVQNTILGLQAANKNATAIIDATADVIADSTADATVSGEWVGCSEHYRNTRGSLVAVND